MRSGGILWLLVMYQAGAGGAIRGLDKAVVQFWCISGGVD